MKPFVVVFLAAIILSRFAHANDSDISPGPIRLIIKSSLLKNQAKAELQFYQPILITSSSDKLITTHQISRAKKTMTQFFRSQRQSMEVNIKNIQEPYYRNLDFDDPGISKILGFRELPLFPGDMIILGEKNGKLHFEGKGAKRLECAYLLRRHFDSSRNVIEEEFPNRHNIGDTILQVYKKIDLLISKAFAILNNFETGINKEEYLLMQAEAISFYYGTLKFRLIPFWELVAIQKSKYLKKAGKIC